MSLTSLPAPQPCPWVCRAGTNGNPPVYTRPLVGSELFTYRFSQMTDGGFDACFAVRLTCHLPKHEVHARTRRAIDRLRFDGPLIAASADSTNSWVYTPVQSAADREAWLNVAFVFQDIGETLDVDSFVNALTHRRLPYTSEVASTLFRCYLIAGPPSVFALVFHGSHMYMDGFSTLNALSLVLEWMTDSHLAVDALPWGTEWQNLPKDLVGATGGTRPTWNTDGKRLLEEIAASRARVSTVLTPGPIPQPSPMLGEPFRLKHTFSESESSAIVAVAKGSGCNVAHFLEAVHCMALAVCNPPDLNKDVDFDASVTIASLEPTLPKSHFVSCFTHLPIRLMVTDILKNGSELARLKLVMGGLKKQYDHYLSNPCIDHLLVAQQNALHIPFYRPPSRSLLTNFGSIERRLPNTWTLKGEHPESDLKPRIQVDEFYVVTRMTGSMIALHSWSLRGKLTLQLQASDLWKDSEGGDTLVRRFFHEILRQIRILLDDHTEPKRSVRGWSFLRSSL